MRPSGRAVDVTDSSGRHDCSHGLAAPLPAWSFLWGGFRCRVFGKKGLLIFKGYEGGGGGGCRGDLMIHMRLPKSSRQLGCAAFVFNSTTDHKASPQTSRSPPESLTAARYWQTWKPPRFFFWARWQPLSAAIGICRDGSLHQTTS